MEKAYRGFDAKRIVVLLLFTAAFLLYIVLGPLYDRSQLIGAFLTSFLLAAILFSGRKARRIMLLVWAGIWATLSLIVLVVLLLTQLHDLSILSVFSAICPAICIPLFIFYLVRKHSAFSITLLVWAFVFLAAFAIAIVRFFTAESMLVSILPALAMILEIFGLLVMDYTGQIPFGKTGRIPAAPVPAAEEAVPAPDPVPAAAPVPAYAPSEQRNMRIVSSLSALDSAWKAGILTDEEYRTKREHILNER